MKKSYKIEVDCPACADKMEVEAKKVKGIKDVNINFMTLKMKVDFEEDADQKSVMEEVRSVCKKVEADSEVYI
ncbi:cation transporter [Peptoniphilus raoultii]|uniref:cation transporter n=1 Tax=Peptoniphilus raoultii TaxID=1776387 RepID=UPI0008DAB37B|nr:cation transporter [Peptoniphilus raoultii]